MVVFFLAELLGQVCRVATAGRWGLSLGVPCSPDGLCSAELPINCALFSASDCNHVQLLLLPIIKIILILKYYLLFAVRIAAKEKLQHGGGAQFNL